MNETEVRGLQERLGVEFGDPDLLRRALTHRSYAFEQGGLDTNERLEFLGDAVLELVVTDLVFHAHPAADEGRLAKLRAAAVRTESLAEVGRELDLGRAVRLGRGEAESGGADKDSILADTLEAVIGAIYLDRGLAVTDGFVRERFEPRLRALAGQGAALDFKTSLQELTAERFGDVPRYELTESGPDHEKTFAATVRIDDRVLGRGVGGSKKRAEQEAAAVAYRTLVEEAETSGAGPDG